MPEITLEDCKKFFNELDTNKDGSLSFEEMLPILS